MFFGFDIGPVHFISISTEYYYFLDEYGTKSAGMQYDWLVEDLKVNQLSFCLNCTIIGVTNFRLQQQLKLVD